MKSIRTTRRPSPKVISIPVHFIGSDESPKPAAVIITPVAAAVRVQKVIRGFLVRKSVKKIKSIRNEVDEIERRISKVEVVELLIKDHKERLRVNESLMALLFKLDSVRGVDSGVRDLRKAVIKKAIALQEKVDGIVAGEYQTLGAANSDQTVEPEANTGNQTVETVDCSSDIVPEEIKDAVTIENELRHDEIVPNLEENVEINIEGEAQYEAESGANVVEENCAVKEIDQNCVVKDVSECLVEKAYTDDYGDENYPNWQSLIEEDEENCSKEGAESMKMEIEDRDDSKTNRNLLEKMVEDNEKMMKMMKQVFERNEQQTRMLNALSHRVEQLEKAFICDKMRRKKKRQC